MQVGAKSEEEAEEEQQQEEEGDPKEETQLNHLHLSPRPLKPLCQWIPQTDRKSVV